MKRFFLFFLGAMMAAGISARDYSKLDATLSEFNSALPTSSMMGTLQQYSRVGDTVYVDWEMTQYNYEYFVQMLKSLSPRLMEDNVLLTYLVADKEAQKVLKNFFSTKGIVWVTRLHDELGHTTCFTADYVSAIKRTKSDSEKQEFARQTLAQNIEQTVSTLPVRIREDLLLTNAVCTDGKLLYTYDMRGYLESDEQAEEFRKIGKENLINYLKSDEQVRVIGKMALLAKLDIVYEYNVGGRKIPVVITWKELKSIYK